MKKVKKQYELNLISILSLLVVISIVILIITVALPRLKGTEKEVAKQQIDKMKENYATTTTDLGDISANGDGSVKASLSNSGILTISGTGKMKDWTSDSQTPWYSKKDSIKKVVIEKGVTNIGNYAFYDLEDTNIKERVSVELADSVTSIGNYAFSTSSIGSIYIPESVTSIGEQAFSFCFGLHVVNIPNGIKKIGNKAFLGCNYLTLANIPDDITGVGDDAFNMCKTKIAVSVEEESQEIIPKLFARVLNPQDILSSTEDSPFTLENCQMNASGDKIKINSSTVLDSEKEVSITINGGKLNGLKIVVVPTGTITYEPLSNGDVMAILHLAEGEKVTNNGGSNIYIFKQNGEFEFEYTDKSGEKRTESAYTEDVEWDISATLNDNVKAKLSSDGELIISGTGNMKDWSDVNNRSPWYGSNVLNIKISDEVTNIGTYAFANCVNLTSIEILSDVTNIGMYAFYECSSLEKIEIPASVTTIGNYVFNYCSNLTKITVDEENENFKDDDGVLYTNDNKTIIKYPEGKLGTKYSILSGVTRIGQYAFSTCNNLKEVDVPSSVTRIDAYAFEYCGNLKEIKIPSTVTSIGDNVFEDCTNLTIITDKYNTYVTNYATENGINYEVRVFDTEYGDISENGDGSVTASLSPDGILRISGTGRMKNNAMVTKPSPDLLALNLPWYYEDATKIVKVIIESGVENISENAFAGCTNLTDITIPTSVTEIASNAFEKSRLSQLTITTYKDAEYVINYAKTNNIKYTLMDVIISGIEYSEKEITNQNVTVTITAEKEINAPDGWSFVPNGENKVITKTYLQNTIETVKITAKDVTSQEVEIRITNIDKEMPKATVSYSTTTLTNGNVVATITANEEIQEVSGWKLSTDKLKLTKEYISNTTASGENITIKDLAGNTSVVNVKITNIDKEAPKATVSYSTTSSTTGSVVVTITSNEEIQEVSGWKLSTDKLKLTKEYISNTIASGENITIRDMAGNISVVNVKITNINTEKPTEEYFNLTQYKIKDKYIVKIEPNTKYSEFIKNIQTNMTYTIKEGSKVLDSTSIMKTGQVLTVGSNSYTIVVMGDLNGDGNISLVELARISKIGAGKITNVSEIEKTAIDINVDGKINIIDLASIAKKYASK